MPSCNCAFSRSVVSFSFRASASAPAMLLKLFAISPIEADPLLSVGIQP
jgi:hypothetical protein